MVVTNYLLTGMILQVKVLNLEFWGPKFWPEALRVLHAKTEHDSLENLKSPYFQQGNEYI